MSFALLSSMLAILVPISFALLAWSMWRKRTNTCCSAASSKPPLAPPPPLALPFFSSKGQALMKWPGFPQWLQVFPANSEQANAKAKQAGTRTIELWRKAQLLGWGSSFLCSFCLLRLLWQSRRATAPTSAICCCLLAAVIQLLGCVQLVVVDQPSFHLQVKCIISLVSSFCPAAAHFLKCKPILKAFQILASNTSS